MAEYLLRHRLGPGRRWVVTSAGVAAARGMPASDAAVRVLDELGIDLRGHRSRPLTRDLLDRAEVVVVMTASHRDQVHAMAPESAGKVHLLRAFHPTEDGDVLDPIGLSEDAYRRIRDEVTEALPGLLAYLGET
jgi:protein-tyrosine phosphatase